MIDLSEIAVDPDFSDTYTISRSSGYFGKGGWIETKSTISMYGAVTVATDEDLAQVPEGDRVTGMMNFYSTLQIYRTHNDPTSKGTSDQIIWNGVYYRVLSVRPPVANYWKCTAARMSGE